MKPLTKNQIKLLKLCDHYGEFDGSCEIESQWGGYEFEGDKDGAKDFRVTRLVIEQLARTLIKRGLVVPSESCSGWTVTDAGRTVLDSLKVK